MVKTLLKGTLAVVSGVVTHTRPGSGWSSYKLEDPAHQATAQTSMTLLINPQADDGSYDSIEVREFSTFVVRYLADITENCMSMHADPAVVEKFRYAVADLPATDTDVRSWPPQCGLVLDSWY